MNKSQRKPTNQVLALIGTAAVYYLAAQASQLVRLQPTDVPAAALAAGVGLAGALLFGWAGGLGVLLGALVFHLGQAGGEQAVWAAAARAAGAAVEAGLTAFLIRRVVRTLPPETVRGVLQCMGICALGAWTGPLVGWAAGQGAGFTAVWTGWMSGLTGMLAAAPLLVIGHLSFVRKANTGAWFLWPMASILVSISLFSFLAVRNNGLESIEERISGDFAEVSSVLQESLAFHDTQAILAIRALYAASERVERDEFTTFTSYFLEEYPNTIGLSWAPRVSAEEREAFEQGVRDGGFPDYYIFERDAEGRPVPAAERSEYFPVMYIEPLNTNRGLLGFDNASNFERLAAIMQARDSGEPVFSAPITLLQNEQITTGILMIMPVFENGRSVETAAQRREHLAGVAVGAFDVEDLIVTSLREISKNYLILYLYDVSEGPKFLVSYGRPEDATTPTTSDDPGIDTLLNGPHRTAALEMGNRTWQLIAVPGSGYTNNPNLWAAWGSLLAGLLLTAAFLAYTDNRQKMESILERSAAEYRSLSEYALTGIIRHRRDGKIIYANNALAEMFGYETATAFMQKTIFEHVNQPDTFEAAVRALPDKAELVNQELGITDRNGEAHRLLFSASVFEDVISTTVVDITERMKTADELRQLSQVVTQAADAVVITDLSGRIVYVNPAFEKITGYTAEEARGKNPRILKSSQHPREFYENMWAAILRGEIFEAEIVNRKKNGEFFHEIKTISPIRSEQGEITHFVATSKDITDRKEMEAALKVEQDRNNALIANATDGIVVLGPSRRFIYASPTARKMFGFEEADVSLLNPVALTHPDDLPLVMETLGIVRADASKIITIQYRSKSKDERWHWIESTYRNMNDDPAIGGIVINFRDISERKEAEEKLQISEHQNRTVLEAIPDWLFRIKRDGTFVYYKTPKGAHLYVPPEVFLGRKMGDVLPAEVAEKGMQAIEQAFALNEPVSFTYELVEDELRSYEARAVANQDEQEVVLIIRDVTEAKKMQDAILASEEKYRQLSEALEEKVKERTAEVQDLYDNAPTGYHSLDSNGVYQIINQTELNWLGYSREEVIGKLTTTDVMTPESAQDFRGIYPIFIERGWVKDLEFTYVRKDGTKLPVLLNATAIYDQDGKFLLSRATVFDNTERKKAQDALQKSRDDLTTANAALAKASKLKDEFLASMSHELRTPLTGILGLAEALQMKTYGELTPKQRRALTNLESSGRHLLDLINDVLDLSKIEADKLDLQPEQVSVSDICQASLQLTKGMAHQKKQMVNFTTNIPAATVRADPRRFKQMIVNLISNAIKFTPESGLLGLEVVGSEEEGVIRLTVWDKGAGIRPEDLGKLFKPFTQLDTSLSRQHSGTGLGLSLVSRLAEMHGGSVSVESTYGEGSRFTITMPWEARPAVQPVKEEPERVKTLRRCLLIEDVELHQKQIGDYLQRLGLEYIPFRQGKGTVELAVGYRPDVILLDLGLPDIPGENVLVNLKNDERTKNIPVIISSVEEDQKLYRELGAAGYLVKPFSIDQLKAELDKISTSGFEPEEEGDSRPAINVLLADDNELILETLADFLRANGCNVVTAKDGRQLVNLVPVAKPDIILTDIQMPGVDGLTAIREIRALQDPEAAGLPIVAITALAMPGDREMCLNAGANEYISKPVKMEKLVKMIREIAAGFKKREA